MAVRYCLRKGGDLLADDSNKFVINVAKDRTYQNQNKLYSEAYLKWRTDEKNPYAFSFVHDTREHSYIAGEGFVKRNSSVAEHIALYKCLGLLGVIMLVMLVFDMINYCLCSFVFPNSGANMVYYSQRHDVQCDISVGFAALFSALSVLRYVAAIIIFKAVTRIPLKVALPDTKVKTSQVCNSTVIMLLVMVIGKISGFVISNILSAVDLDSVYTYMFVSDNQYVQGISFLLNCLLLPILCEIFYRGFVLQTFRQFGDSYAILVSSIICGFSFYDLSYVGYAICCSVILGLFTIRTGSVNTAIVMHIVSTSCSYFITSLEIQNTSSAKIAELVVCTLITSAALVAYSRLNDVRNWSFNISSDPSEIPFSKKIRVMLSSNTIALWMVCSIILTILSARVIR